MSAAEPPVEVTLEPLIAGQRMGRVKFHERYEAMPPGTTFELIAGKVTMASPVSGKHSDACGLVSIWLGQYVVHTPGIRLGHDGSLLLSDESEVQPDLMLRIEPRLGGQTRREGAYIAGCPELVVEVARSSQTIDLGPKLIEYDKAGALEYLVFTIEPDDIHWHARRGGRLVGIEPDADGLYRSGAFPGLWLDPVAFSAENVSLLLATLQRGLDQDEHAAFVARLTQAEP